MLGLRLSKELGRDDFSKIPNGAPGLETRMPLVYDGGVRRNGMSLNRYVELTATAPAKLFGLFPRKGTIAVGSDADIVLFDPDEAWTIRAAEHHSRVEYSMFEGREVTGRVNKVFLRGELIVDGRNWLGREGGGRFVKARPGRQAEVGGIPCPKFLGFRPCARRLQLQTRTSSCLHLFRASIWARSVGEIADTWMAGTRPDLT